MVRCLSEFHQSSNPVQTHLLHKCYSVITCYLYIFIYMHLSVAHTSRSGKEASGAYDHLGELDQALFMYLDHGSGHGATHQEQRRKCVLARHACSPPTGIQLQLPCFCLPFLLAGSQMQLIISGSNACRLGQSYQLLVVFFSFWPHLVAVVTVMET
jgi:hypothetical protein